MKHLHTVPDTTSDVATPDAALTVFNASRAFYGLPPVAEIPSGARRPALWSV